MYTTPTPDDWRNQYLLQYAKRSIRDAADSITLAIDRIGPDRDTTQLTELRDTLNDTAARLAGNHTPQRTTR
ncbi:hypothetical protein AALA48_08620 [Bifidobacterium pseudolongum]|mgnify:CR=1 FL=1|jgi:hypothetical protein|uniref:hypothetical protein n=1 Tax=Bifidobacterium pseudolongum TaxID=1694 RepID=UPI003517F226|nr:hypothetical protein [Bifidobacterium pseudolongum]